MREQCRCAESLKRYTREHAVAEFRGDSTVLKSQCHWRQLARYPSKLQYPYWSLIEIDLALQHLRQILNRCSGYMPVMRSSLV